MLILTDPGSSRRGDFTSVSRYAAQVLKRWQPLCISILLVASPTNGESIDWIRQFGTTADDVSFGVSADSLGNVFTAGWINGVSNVGGYDSFVSDYDPSGNLRWTRQLGTTDDDAAYGVSADGLGDAYASGHTRGSLGGPNAGGDDAFVAKYDSTGNLLWTRQIGSAQDDASYAVSADGLGNVYISGHTRGSLNGSNAGGDDAFAAKFTSYGSLSWIRQFGTVGEDRAWGISADRFGNVFVAGQANGSFPIGNEGTFVRRYDPNGNLQWSHQLTSGGGYNLALAAAADGNGNLYISGATSASGGNPDAFVTKYDVSGDLTWSRQLGTSGSDAAQGVSADYLGNVLISGFSEGSLAGPKQGLEDAFTSKFDASGGLAWTQQLGTSDLNYAQGVATDGWGNIYIANDTNGSLGGPNVGGFDGFIAKISDTPEPSSGFLALGAAIFVLAWRGAKCDRRAPGLAFGYGVLPLGATRAVSG